LLSKSVEGKWIVLVGQSLSSLPAEQRAERYRQFAAQAMLKAKATEDPVSRAEYLTMASGWHTLAQEAERASSGTIPGETAITDNPEILSDDLP